MAGALAVGGFGFIPRSGSAPLFAETALGGVVGFAALVTDSSGFASTGGGDGCAGTSATGSAGFTSAGGADCCDSPHPTSTTAAIVVISMCFISLQLSILHPSCRRAFGGGWRFCVRIISGIGLWKKDVYFSSGRFRLRGSDRVLTFARFVSVFVIFLRSTFI